MRGPKKWRNLFLRAPTLFFKYTTSPGRAAADQSSIELIFSKHAHEQRVLTLRPFIDPAGRAGLPGRGARHASQ
jgi:hypothetical protein